MTELLSREFHHAEDVTRLVPAAPRKEYTQTFDHLVWSPHLDEFHKVCSLSEEVLKVVLRYEYADYSRMPAFCCAGKTALSAVRVSMRHQLGGGGRRRRQVGQELHSCG